MKPFNYVLAGNISDAISWAHNYSGSYLAGGTDILMGIKSGQVQPTVLVDLKGISGLKGINTDHRGIHIGALTTVREMETSPVLKEKVPMLAMAASRLGSVQVRNRATIGGNLCNAAPSAELAPALLCLEATVEITGLNGLREVALEQFFTGPRRTVIQPGEIVTGILFPQPKASAGGVYYKLSVRKAMDIAFVGVAVLLEVYDEIIVKARIGLGAVAPVPMRARAAEEVLNGSELTAARVKEAAAAAAAACQPISDLRSSAEYRRDMVRNYVARGVEEAFRLANPVAKGMNYEQEN